MASKNSSTKAKREDDPKRAGKGKGKAKKNHPQLDVMPDAKSSAIRLAIVRLRAALDDLERAAFGETEEHGSREPAITLPLVRRDVMKPREYAEYMRVNVRKVHSWIKQGMPHFLLEGRIRLRVKEADAWLESRRSNQQHEMEQARQA